MKTRQFLFAAATSLLVAAPAFATADVSIYEQLAAFQRELQKDNAQGVAGASGPTMPTAERRVPTQELRIDASIYEQVIAAQRDMGHF